MEGWPSLRVFIDFTLLIFLSCILSREPILRLTALDGFFDNLRAPEFQVLCFYQRFIRCPCNQTARVTLPERRQRVQA
jgi:hypothetical protein